MEKPYSSSSLLPVLHNQIKLYFMGLNKTVSSLLCLLIISLGITLFVMYTPNIPSMAIRPIPKEDLSRDRDELMSCDLFTGKWVRGDDGRGPAYTNRTCRTIPDSKNCGKYGKDQDFVGWRWRPDGCELPRFDPEVFLSMVRGKKMAFVGDSLARNQMESLLCLLSQAETPIDVYKDADDRFRTWHFNSHKFTLMVLWSKFLVDGQERLVNGTFAGAHDVHIDRIDTNWASKLHEIDYIVISTGRWFSIPNYLHEAGKVSGCVYCSEEEIAKVGVDSAIRRAVRTALEFIARSKEFKGFTLVRTYSPEHFEGGAWNTGGDCNRTRPLDEGDGHVRLDGSDWEIWNGQVEEVERMRVRREGKRFAVLDVTKAMKWRADGHPGSHWNNQWMRGYNDCVHWCMPGAIDMWNDLLLAVLKKKKTLL